jgi:hypothetical protein
MKQKIGEVSPFWISTLFTLSLSMHLSCNVSFFLSSFAPSFALKTLFYFAVLSVKYNVHTWVLQIDRLWRQSWTKKSFPEKGKKFSLVYNGKNFGGFMADLKNSKLEKELKFWNFAADFCFIRYWYWMSDSKVILDENTSQRTKPKT